MSLRDSNIHRGAFSFRHEQACEFLLRQRQMFATTHSIIFTHFLPFSNTHTFKYIFYLQFNIHLLTWAHLNTFYSHSRTHTNVHTLFIGISTHSRCTICTFLFCILTYIYTLVHIFTLISIIFAHICSLLIFLSFSLTSIHLLHFHALCWHFHKYTYKHIFLCL